MSYNMSYCRFQNTLGALRECAQALEEMTSNEPVHDEDCDPEDCDCDFVDNKLSREEERAKEELILLCREIVESYGDNSDL